MPDDAPLKSEAAPRPDPAIAEARTAKPSEKPVRTATPEAVSAKRKKSNLRRLIALVVLAVAVIGGATYWWLNRGLVSTDDAFVDGNAVTLSPQVGGKVLRLLIDDNQPVKAGDLLLEIDPRDYAAARDSAKAQLARAEAGRGGGERQSRPDQGQHGSQHRFGRGRRRSGDGGAGPGQGPARLHDRRGRPGRGRRQALPHPDQAGLRLPPDPRPGRGHGAQQRGAGAFRHPRRHGRPGEDRPGPGGPRSSPHRGAAGRGQGRPAALAPRPRSSRPRRAPHRRDQPRLYQDPGAADRPYTKRRQVNAGDVVEKNQILADPGLWPALGDGELTRRPSSPRCGRASP